MALDAKSALAPTEEQLGGWLALRGLITFFFGLLFATRPGGAIPVLMGLFAGFCLLDGVLALSSSITVDNLRSRALLAIEGLLSFAAGVVTWAFPRHMAIAVLVVIAVRALGIGALEVLSALRLGHQSEHPRLFAVAGLVSILFGIALLIHPQSGVYALAWLVGAYGIVLGAVELAFGFGIGHLAERVPPLPTATTHA